MSAVTRRTALTGIALAGSTALLPAAAASMARAAPVDRSAWDRAFAVYRGAKAKDQAFEPIFDAMYKQVKAEEAAVPHITLRPDPYTGHFTPVTTENGRFMTHARKWVGDVAAGKMRLDPIESLQNHFELCKDAVAADDKRNAAIAAIHTRHDWDAMNDKYDALVEETCAAESVVITTPAPDHDALLWKMERLFGPDVRPDEDSGDCWCAEWMNSVLADARRLLAQGRA
jgi:hypothetical protein